MTRFKFKNRLTALAVLSSVLVSGCANLAHKSEIDATGAELDAMNARNLAANKSAKPPVVMHIKGAWLAPQVASLGEDAALPAEFLTSDFGIGWPGRSNLRTIAERLQKHTGIPIRLTSDVEDPNGSEGVAIAARPASSRVPVAPPAPLTLPPPIPTERTGLSTSPIILAGANANDMEVNFQGSLKEFLNRVADHFSVSWEYRDGGIYFYRFVTKEFRVNANPGKSSFKAKLGKTSGGTGSSSGDSTGSNFNSSGEVTSEVDINVWNSLQAQLELVKTPAGKLAVNPDTGTVTIRDTREGVNAVERVIKGQNALLTQQVGIRVEMYAVTSNDARELGINWNGVFQRLSNLAPQLGLSFSSPASLVSPGAGSLGVSILAPQTSDASVLQRFSGSQALVQALKGVGRVHLTETAEAVTLNRQPTPLASTNQQTYLASTTPGSSAAGGSALPGLTPGTVTTGFISYMLPTVLDNGGVLLKFSLDSSVLQSMGLISTGQGGSLQSINTPNVSGNSGIHQVILKPGATLVMSGLTRNSELYDQKTLADYVGLGGSYAGRREKTTVVILVTAQMLPGA